MNLVIKKRSPYGVLSLTLGIISIIYALFWYISIPTGIIAINLGIKGKSMVGSKLAFSGIVTGIVGVSLAGLITLLKIIIVAFVYISSL